jgi:molecular chaperone DnaJ
VYRGSDLSYAMEITLEEAARGKDAQIRIPQLGKLRHLPRQRRQARHQCQDLHHLHRQRHGADAPGLLQRAADLPALPRHGQDHSRALHHLPRPGQDQEAEDAGGEDSAGIDDGMRIRSTGNGEPGTNGGPPGDLYIEIRIKKHDIFERDGDDLHCQVPVSFITAALGGEIEVPTLAGKAAIDIPEGTQAGKQFRLRGKGIKGVRASYPGDLYCHIAVETPVKLTEHQRKLLRELEDSLKKGGATRPAAARG